MIKLVIFICLLLVAVQGTHTSARQLQAANDPITADVQAALDHISADSLRGHLSFIASDLLEGRNTPSPGLEIAAEYIAAQFRRAGLEPAGDQEESNKKSYFQTADFEVSEADSEAFNLLINDGLKEITVGIDKVTFPTDQALALNTVQIVKVGFKPVAELAELKQADIEGKVVLSDIPDIMRVERERRSEVFRARNDFLGRIRVLNAALIVSVDRYNAAGRGPGSGRLIDPERQRGGSFNPPAFLSIHDRRIVEMFDLMRDGEKKGTITLNIAESVRKPVKLRNVIGLLRGSDPVLSETCVIVSAHYDHVGVNPGIPGDAIFNGANDDGSGTVSVIELASALSKLKNRPKRSILFIAWFGEEKGLLGSRFYGRNPVFPLAKTVAMVNLEQVGRTDTSEGPQVKTASMTGFDFTDMGPIFKAAGEKTGITVYKHERNSDAFFGRSDNQALADQGVPAHTLCVAFVYPDYHLPGDHWDKIDYDNMAGVNRMIALALVMIADNPEPPKWNTANPKTEKYVKAWEALQK